MAIDQSKLLIAALKEKLKIKAGDHQEELDARDALHALEIKRTRNEAERGA